MSGIRVSELFQLSNPIIIDIRNYYYYNLGHISGAISVPYYNLLNNYSHYLNKYNRYYLYCENGEQSLEIVQRLNSFGYDTVNIIGGYQEYVKFIDGMGKVYF
ncbi:MAG: rhodanese-like domain-containing protein [Erysipelotrichaceae bacterium]|nr:rhodanese-like domain-containing protein [Erysipelotrichaceae bacterium]